MVKQGEKGSLKGRVWKGRSVVRGLEGKVRGEAWWDAWVDLDTVRAVVKFN